MSNAFFARSSSGLNSFTIAASRALAAARSGSISSAALKYSASTSAMRARVRSSASRASLLPMTNRAMPTTTPTITSATRTAIATSTALREHPAPRFFGFSPPSPPSPEGSGSGVMTGAFAPEAPPRRITFFLPSPPPGAAASISLRASAASSWPFWMTNFFLPPAPPCVSGAGLKEPVAAAARAAAVRGPCLRRSDTPARYFFMSPMSDV